MPTHLRKAYTDAEEAWKQLSKRIKELENGVGLSLKETERLQRYQSRHLEEHNKRFSTLKAAKKLKKFLGGVAESYRQLCVIVFPQDRISLTRQRVLDAFIELTNATELQLSEQARSILESTPGKQKNIQDSSSSVKYVEPSPESVTRVFPCKTAKKIKTLKKGGLEYKAVTMSFPKYGNDPKLDKPCSCMMTMEYSDEYMKELMKALFDVEVDFASGTHRGVQVLHESGLVGTMQFLSLTGGQCDKILEVFGKEIQLAITECKTYKDEDKRNNRTMCISAVCVKGEGKVILEMDVDTGLRLAEMLYVTNN
ncbi:uncharacterized protein SETTUDRAFT_39914 [Exserohilum turcica Et28A]|uniref:Uncharacterized protein n=1 Tax=Exserohilum turcicum (strain 28A) TaxID=671987 RepID=R0IM50_EXST2|nr:uncharacterized protein SETTUDRAFT_39914 [Exserohilum turcica Et28A]EOA85891.1 hypothetical protein SETTUDRAFT_39914 [Exserohilum turcica Et28A]